MLKTDKEKGHIDLSLRRVSLSTKINKNNELKQEQKAERLLEQLAKILNIDKKIIFQEIGDKIIKEYGVLAPFLKELSTNPKLIKDIDIKKEYEKELVSLVKERIKPQSIKKDARIELKSFEKDGITRIKQTLKEIKNFYEKNDYDAKLTYLSAPFYRLSIISSDFKKAEKELKDIEKESQKIFQKNKIEGNFLND